jgi:hypothetical protein
MFKLVFLFVLFAFCFSNVQSVSDVVSGAVSDAQGEFASIIGSVAPVAFFVVAAIVGIALAVKLFRKAGGFVNPLGRDGWYRNTWDWKGYQINTSRDFTNAFDDWASKR